MRRIVQAVVFVGEWVSESDELFTVACSCLRRI